VQLLLDLCWSLAGPCSVSFARVLSEWFKVYHFLGPGSPRCLSEAPPRPALLHLALCFFEFFFPNPLGQRLFFVAGRTSIIPPINETVVLFFRFLLGWYAYGVLSDLIANVSPGLCLMSGKFFLYFHYFRTWNEI